MLRYYITDRHLLGGMERLLESVAKALVSGVDFLQLREKDLSARALLQLAITVKQLPNPRSTRILMNDRLDIALAADLDGVHLRAHSISPQQLRQLTKPSFLVAVSCHSPTEAKIAEEEGADFVVLGPIFPTPSKLSFGTPLGITAIQEAARVVRIPVLALGGVNEQNQELCREAGATGIAGIRLFQ
jgi:thiamine-phosphate pyrophosphorylase